MAFKVLLCGQGNLADGNSICAGLGRHNKGQCVCSNHCWMCPLGDRGPQNQLSMFVIISQLPANIKPVTLPQGLYQCSIYYRRLDHYQRRMQTNTFPPPLFHSPPKFPFLFLNSDSSPGLPDPTVQPPAEFRRKPKLHQDSFQ